MKRFLMMTLPVLAALGAPLAAETVEGYLIDKACSAEAMAGDADALKAHTKECALMPDCKASGYGVATDDGRFLKFDEGGDGMAEKFLGFQSEKDNLRVAVSGTIDGGAIQVVAIQLAF